MTSVSNVFSADIVWQEVFDRQNYGTTFGKSRAIYLLETIDRLQLAEGPLAAPELAVFLNTAQEFLPEMEGSSTEDMDELLTDLFRVYRSLPRIWLLLEQLANSRHQPDTLQYEASASGKSTTTKPSLDAQSLIGYVESQLPKVDWHVELDYLAPEPGSEIAKVLVTMTKHPSRKPDASIKLHKLKRAREIKCRIHSIAPYMEIAGETEEVISLLPEDSRKTLLFLVTPRTSSGLAEVSVDIEVEDALKAVRVNAKKIIKLTPGKPDVVLTVLKKERSLDFSLRFAHEVFDRDLGSKGILTDNLKGYFDRVFRYLNRKAIGRGELDVDSLRSDLEAIGSQFYDQLLPDKLKDLFRDQLLDTAQSILLLLDEDTVQIPWELIVPDRPDQFGEYLFLCERYQLGRWLIRHSTGVRELSQLIRIEPLALISHNPGLLDGVECEREHLHDLFGEQLRLVTASEEEVKSYLASDTMGDCYGLHMSGDGRYLDEAEGCEFKLADGQMRELVLSHPAYQAFGQTSPFVFLNFCESGTFGHSLTRAHGWATRFLDIGASCLVVTMWKANDQTASDFSRNLYGNLLAGKSIGESMQIARHEIANSGDATWLCYALYGDPRAMVTRASHDDNSLQE